MVTSPTIQLHTYMYVIVSHNMCDVASSPQSYIFQVLYTLTLSSGILFDCLKYLVFLDVQANLAETSPSLISAQMAVLCSSFSMFKVLKLYNFGPPYALPIKS